MSKKDKKLEYKTGINVILEHTLYPYEKMSVLRLVMDRFRFTFSDAIRKLLFSPVECVIQQPVSARFEDVESMTLSDSNAILVIFNISSFGNKGIIRFSDDLVFAFVNILLGGSNCRGNTAKDLKQKSKTLIEQSVMQKIAKIVLAELSDAFSLIQSVEFSINNISLHSSFAQIANPKDSVIHIPFELISENCSGMMDLILPFEDIMIATSTTPYTAKNGSVNNENWQQSLALSAKDITFAMDAVIYDNDFKNLSDILHLKIGDTIVLNHRSQDDVTLRCGQVMFASGKLGAVENAVAININKKL